MFKIIIFVVIWSGHCRVVKRHDWNSLRWHSTDHDLKGIHGSKPIGPKKKSLTGPGPNFENLGPIRTWWSVYPWSYWSNCCHVQYRQCIIAVCMEWLNYQVINRLRWSSYSDRIMVRVSASEFFWIDMPEKVKAVMESFFFVNWFSRAP